ncbi:Round spore [Balamuthia mandrillaris]
MQNNAAQGPQAWLPCQGKRQHHLKPAPGSPQLKADMVDDQGSQPQTMEDDKEHRCSVEKAKTTLNAQISSREPMPTAASLQNNIVHEERDAVEAPQLNNKDNSKHDSSGRNADEKDNDTNSLYRRATAPAARIRATKPLFAASKAEDGEAHYKRENQRLGREYLLETQRRVKAELKADQHLKQALSLLDYLDAIQLQLKELREPSPNNNGTIPPPCSCGWTSAAAKKQLDELVADLQQTCPRFRQTLLPDFIPRLNKPNEEEDEDEETAEKSPAAAPSAPSRSASTNSSRCADDGDDISGGDSPDEGWPFFHGMLLLCCYLFLPFSLSLSLFPSTFTVNIANKTNEKKPTTTELSLEQGARTVIQVTTRRYKRRLGSIYFRPPLHKGHTVGESTRSRAQRTAVAPAGNKFKFAASGPVQLKQRPHTQQPHHQYHDQHPEEMPRRSFLEQESLKRQMEDQRRRDLVVQELLATERTYFEDLTILVNVFKQRLVQTKVITITDAEQLFSNAEVLIVTNSQLLHCLEREVLKDIASQCIGQVFLEMLEKLEVYSDYCANQNAALDLLFNLKTQKDDESFVRCLETIMTEQPETRNLDIQSFIIKPLQRICKYPLLIKELLKCTPETHKDRASLVEASAKMQMLLNKINSLLLK